MPDMNIHGMERDVMTEGDNHSHLKENWKQTGMQSTEEHRGITLNGICIAGEKGARGDTDHFKRKSQ